ncbi:hypothetical protein IQ258_19610 [Coleofasciculus sp. LEGE 07081]|uniref:ATP-binding protein n=1 Tax=Coleofasciculus sp. LEGE 07081 TaxID=2777967 RepID=UPI001882724D|nr:hypothetical protein [Coleofasciculus sp. LEGE 07081]MBE9128310.1 hypothetical protein [Coleofasciculus sp. LEGE 07081]
MIASIGLNVAYQVKQRLVDIPDAEVSLVGEDIIVVDSPSFLSCTEIAKFVCSTWSGSIGVLFSDQEISSHLMPSLFQELREGCKEPGVYAVSSGLKELALIARKCGFEVVSTSFKVLGSERTIMMLPLRDGGNPERLSLILAESNILPSETSFFGRSELLQRVLDELREGEHVCLTGCGGVGKTRLAKEVAIKASQSGYSKVSIASLSEHNSNIKARQHLSDVAEGLLARETENLLTIIDNCEHVMDAVSDFVNQPEFREIPGRFLFTSREAISVPDIRNIKVPGLATPAEDEVPESYLEYASIQLLQDRLANSREFVLELGELETAGKIVRLLSGLPLAIEQVASNLTDFSLEDVLGQLEIRLHELQFVDNQDEARHQTILKTMEWSFDLLSQPEKRALGAAVSLQGLFKPNHISALTYELAERNLIPSLEKKSLVQRVIGDAKSPYEVIPCIRDCARVSLSQHLIPVPELTDFCLAVVEDAYRETNEMSNIWGMEDMSVLSRTIEVCFESLLESNDKRTPGALAKAYRYYTSAGNATSLLPIFDQILASLPTDHEEFLSLLNGKGQLEWQAGRIDEAKSTLSELSERAAASGDFIQSATALGNIAVLELNYGDLSSAEAPLLKAQSIFAEHGEIARYWACTTNLIYISVVTGRGNEFRHLAVEALFSYFEGIPNHIRPALLVNFADVFEAAGDHQRREQCLRMILESSVSDEDNHSFEPALLRLIPNVFYARPHDAAVLFGIIQDYLSTDENLGRQQFRERHAEVFELLDSDEYREAVLSGNFLIKGKRAIEAYNRAFPS